MKGSFPSLGGGAATPGLEPGFPPPCPGHTVPCVHFSRDGETGASVLGL